MKRQRKKTLLCFQFGLLIYSFDFLDQNLIAYEADVQLGVPFDVTIEPNLFKNKPEMVVDCLDLDITIRTAYLHFPIDIHISYKN